MEDTPTRIEVDCTTGEQTVVLLTDEEIADIAVRAEQAVADQAVAEAEAVVKADAKADLLVKLGITADEAKLLLS